MCMSISLSLLAYLATTTLPAQRRPNLCLMHEFAGAGSLYFETKILKWFSRRWFVPGKVFILRLRAPLGNTLFKSKVLPDVSSPFHTAILLPLKTKVSESPVGYKMHRVSLTATICKFVVC